jgi:hypothetical protein
MVGYLLHAPRGPFYSPKVARSRWRSTRKAILAFCRVAHRTVRCTTEQPLFMLVRDLLPILVKQPLQIRGGWSTRHCPVHTGQCPVHTGQSGVPCRPLARATCRPRVARPTVALAAVGSPDSPVHHWTVR